MPEVKRRKAKTEGPKDNWTYEQRAANYYDHQYHNLKTHETLKRRGVKDGGGVTANYTHEGMTSYVKPRKKKK